MLVQSSECGRRFCGVPDNEETSMDWGQMEIYIKTQFSMSSGQTKTLPAVSPAPFALHATLLQIALVKPRSQESRPRTSNSACQK